MSRLFDGVNDEMVYTVPASGIDVNGAHTLLIVVRQIATSDTIWQSYIETQTSAAAAAATLGRNNVGQVYWAQGATATSAISMTDSDNWVVAAARKTAGSSIPTFSKCVVGGANTHTAGGGSLVASPSIASGTIRIGGNDDFANIRVAAAAIFTRVLSDAEINGINAALTTQSIFDLTPVWLVDDLDGFATDYMNNADRTSIVGTADDADDPAGWVFGISGGGDGDVTSPAATGLGDFPAPSFSAGSTVTAPAADALGDFPDSEMQIGSDVTAPAALTFGDFPVPTVTGTGDSTVVGVPATAVGDFPAPAFQSDWTIEAPAATGLGDFPVPTVTGEAGATVNAVPADATGDFPAPGVDDGSAPLQLVALNQARAATFETVGSTTAAFQIPVASASFEMAESLVLA